MEQLLYASGPAYTSRLILTGDFNVNTLSSPSPLLDQLLSLMSSLSLNQHVTQTTHYSHTGTPSIIDLVLIPQSLSSHQYFNSPVTCIVRSQKVIHASITLPYSHNSHAKQLSRSVWLYHLADLESINESLLSLDWESLLPSTLDKAWSTFTSIFFSIVHHFTPTKILSHTPYLHGFPTISSIEFTNVEDYITKPFPLIPKLTGTYIVPQELNNICNQASEILLLKLTLTIPSFLLDLRQVP